MRNVLERVINIRRANQKIVCNWIKEYKQKIRVYVVKLTCPSSKERIRLATMMQTFPICEFKDEWRFIKEYSPKSVMR